MKIGGHINSDFGYYNAVYGIHQIGGNALQISIKNTNLGYFETKSIIPEEDAKKCKKFIQDKEIFLINHSIHKINFARDPNENHNAIKSLVDDLEQLDKLGGYGSVFHMGKKLQMSEETAINNMISSIERVYELSKHTKSKILLENSAGEGSALFKIEIMKEIYDSLAPEIQDKVEFVFDTCHSFSAGYDLSSAAKVKTFYKKIDNLLGWNKVAAIHLNDSSEPFDSHKDRHQNLLLGHIYNDNKRAKGLEELIKICKKTNIPLILETDPCLHIAEIQLIKRLSEN